MAASSSAEPPVSFGFKWSIENFTKLKTEKLYSEVFYVGRCEWRVMLFPGGNKKPGHLSVYLDVANSKTLRPGWGIRAEFSLTVINPNDDELSVRKDIYNYFSEKESDWGFVEFMLLSDLTNPVNGYLLNDTLSVEAYVTVKKVVNYSLKRKASHPIEKVMELDAAPAAGNTVKFLSYNVSSEASQVLEKIHNLHKSTFTKFSMKIPAIQTVILQSLASFIKSMSTTKVSEMNEEAFCSATVLVKDFEQVGLDLSWLNQRLDEAKRINKHFQSLNTIDSYNKALEVARAKVCELEEKIAKAKTEAEAFVPKSLGVNDRVLAGVF